MNGEEKGDKAGVVVAVGDVLFLLLMIVFVLMLLLKIMIIKIIFLKHYCSCCSCHY